MYVNQVTLYRTQPQPITPRNATTSLFGRRHKKFPKRLIQRRPDLLLVFSPTSGVFTPSFFFFFRPSRIVSLLFLVPSVLVVPSAQPALDGSFTASVARRLPASHSHLTGEVNGGGDKGVSSVLLLVLSMASEFQNTWQSVYTSPLLYVPSFYLLVG